MKLIGINKTTFLLDRLALKADKRFLYLSKELENFYRDRDCSSDQEEWLLSLKTKKNNKKLKVVLDNKYDVEKILKELYDSDDSNFNKKLKMCLIELSIEIPDHKSNLFLNLLNEISNYCLTRGMTKDTFETIVEIVVD